jgi:hypothetical protein
MDAVLTELERRRRAELNSDTREALRGGQSLEQFLEAREALADQWAQWFHVEMEKFGVTDPIEVVPNALARLEQRCVAEAREAAKAAAREELQRMLRRAIT